jgi:hypothetical protein
MVQTYVAPLNHSLLEITKQHLQNPGRLYNYGNYVALAAAFLHCIVSAQIKGAATSAEIMDFFLGSWPALFTSLAVMLFFVSGKKYAMAWAKGFPPLEIYNSHGHALSAIGAVLVGIGLIGLSQNWISLMLAVITTLLHAGGKFGSWSCAENDRFFKMMPLFSRVIYITSLGLDILAISLQSNYGAEMLVQMLFPVLLVCAAMVWARADWMLRA